MKNAGIDAAAEKMVPCSFLRGIFETGTLPKADLIYGKAEGGYRLRVYVGEQTMIVSRREGDEPRIWRDLNRAVSFIRDQFGVIRDLSLIHPVEVIETCKPTEFKRTKRAAAKR